MPVTVHTEQTVVDAVAAVLADVTLWPDLSEKHRDVYRARAQEVVSVLADSGRLLPDGGETREEWRIRFVDPDGQEHTRVVDSERLAGVHVGELATKGITAQKERRAVIVSPGPWEPVHD